jgi:enoyl-CoA hydratase
MTTTALTNYEKIIYEVKGEVAWVTFNDPTKYNCISMKLLDEFIDVLQKIEVDDGIKCVVITGAGDKAFSSGGDLTHFDTLFDLVNSYNFVRNAAYRQQNLITNTEKIFIAAINGACFAGGLEIALCCDFRIASSKATTGVLEVNFGIIPGAGGTARLSKFLTPSKAKELLMTGDRISADEAYRLCLFDKVVPHEKLYEAVNELVAKICSKPFLAIRMIKTAVNTMFETPGLNAALEIERGVNVMLTRTDDFKEGVASFLEKRAPKWRGR